MNKRQKEVLQASLDNEKEVLKALEKNYTKALADIKKNIRELQAMPGTQSKAYQIEFQKQLESQISAYLEVLKGNNYKTISDYMNKCYEEGFVGSLYSLQGLGEDIIIPIDQDAVIKAVKLTGDVLKLSEKLEGNTKILKQNVLAEMQRGFATSFTYADIARNISNLGNADMNRSMRIARTEGHRVQCQANMDCAHKARESGCDTVKQWNATLDKKTRVSHQRVDKEWRELDEPFSNGLMYPGDPNGGAKEVINCRCSLDDVPRWYVEAGGGQYRRDNETGNIIKCKNYAEFKEKYLNDVGRLDKVKWNKVVTSTDKYQFQKFKSVLGKKAPKTLDEFCKIKYNKNEWDMFKAYSNSIKSGELTPLADFKLYKEISNQIDNEFVGLTTANGIVITGKSKHFIARVIGSVEQKRNGVSIDDIIAALKSPEDIKPVRKNKNGNSQKFINDKCAVTVNPDTGNLIQVNPYKRRVSEDVKYK